MSSTSAPESINSATARSVPARVLECRNQPVSMAIAVTSPAATSGVYVAPQRGNRLHDEHAGRLGGRILENGRPQVVFADMVVYDHPGPGN